MAKFCLLEKVSTKILVGRDLSIFEITTLFDRLEDTPNAICVILGDIFYNVAVNIFNATASRPVPSDIAPRGDWEVEWQTSGAQSFEVHNASFGLGRSGTSRDLDLDKFQGSKSGRSRPLRRRRRS